MQTGKIYKIGFLTFLAGTVLIGVLLGTISYCYAGGGLVSGLGISQESFLELRRSLNFGRIMVNSLSGTTIFLAAACICGLCSVGQPVSILILLARGAGLGLTLSQLYVSGGKEIIPYAIGLVVPGAAISTAAIIIGAREAVGLSNIYLKISLSDRQEDGLLPALKLYGAKFIVLEAILAVSAGTDCLCTFLFIGKF